QLAQAVAERIALALVDEPWPDTLSSEVGWTGCPFACSCDSAAEKQSREVGMEPTMASRNQEVSADNAEVEDHRLAAAEPPLAQGLTLLPCQGIKRSGARIAQRTAYHLCEDEDKLLGKAQPLCVSALAAGVPEDVHYYRDFPTVALNGCPQNCATKIAELFGIPAVRSVNLYQAFPEYSCETRSLEPDLTPQESELARRWAEQLLPELRELLVNTRWQPRSHCTHGMVNDPSGIERFFGYQPTSHGYDLPCLSAATREFAPHPVEANSATPAQR
ncbi:MAG: putative zinc-binding protein, partial [Gemmatales bacterium]|nr:putative zinc-binding protein [Gemmatales bacterium]MDW8174320.1 putative zinc-binding protein [Gemmatales bacterium]